MESLRICFCRTIPNTTVAPTCCIDQEPLRTSNSKPKRNQNVYARYWRLPGPIVREQVANRNGSDTTKASQLLEELALEPHIASDLPASSMLCTEQIRIKDRSNSGERNAKGFPVLQHFCRAVVSPHSGQRPLSPKGRRRAKGRRPNLQPNPYPIVPQPARGALTF